MTRIAAIIITITAFSCASLRGVEVADAETARRREAAGRLADQTLAKASAKARAGDVAACAAFAADALAVRGMPSEATVNWCAEEEKKR